MEKKIYGIYPGLADEASIGFATEAEIYLAIRNFEHQIAEAREHEVGGIFMRVNGPDLTEEYYTLDFLKYHTRNFGVEMEEPVEGRRVVETPSYKKWYSFYKNHFSEFTREQWETFNRVMMHRGDLSEFLPKTSWQDAMDLTMTPNSQNNEE